MSYNDNLASYTAAPPNVASRECPADSHRSDRCQKSGKDELPVLSRHRERSRNRGLRSPGSAPARRPCSARRRAGTLVRSRHSWRDRAGRRGEQPRTSRARDSCQRVERVRGQSPSRRARRTRGIGEHSARLDRADANKPAASLSAGASRLCGTHRHLGPARRRILPARSTPAGPDSTAAVTSQH